MRSILLGAALLSSLALFGCGGHATVPLTRTEAQTVHQHAADLWDRMRGSATQRAALDFLTDYDLNQEFRECMVENGYARVAAPDVTAAVDPFGDTVWLRALRRPIASETLRATAQAERDRQARESRIRGDAYLATIRSCREASPEVSDDVLDARGFVAVDGGQAVQRFQRLAESVDSALGSRAAYSRCMANVGLPRLMDSAPAARDIPLGDEVPSARWDRFLMAEQRFLETDATCRKEKFLMGMSRIGPMLESFESDNSATLAAYDRHWATVTTEASSRGWEP